MTKTAAAPNENHHLWNNNGTYWCHFTVHPPDYTKRRVRVSLHTSDLAEARRRRDALLASVPMIVNRIPRGRTCVRPDVQRGPNSRDSAPPSRRRMRSPAAQLRGARQETRVVADLLTGGSGPAIGGA